MMSNNRVMSSGFTRCVPVDIVVVDEASQIDVGDYLPLMNKFRPTIRKMVFIGDDKQRKSSSIYERLALSRAFAQSHRTGKTTSKTSEAYLRSRIRRSAYRSSTPNVRTFAEPFFHMLTLTYQTACPFLLATSSRRRCMAAAFRANTIFSP